MTIADLIELLQHADNLQAPVTVRVWETNAAGNDLPVFSRCAIRDVTEDRGIVILDVEEA